MFCLIYKSVADSGFDQSDIVDLLEQAKDFNRENNITGCLLYYDSQFVQYLEGDSVKVTALFEKIKEDRRHKEVQLLFSGYIYSREFNDWTMAYENLMGSNNSLEYLKILVSSYFDKVNVDAQLNPTTKKFWVVVKKLWATHSVEKYH